LPWRVSEPTDGSAWLSGGQQKYRVLRGGSRFDDARKARTADRCLSKDLLEVTP